MNAGRVNAKVVRMGAVALAAVAAALVSGCMGQVEAHTMNLGPCYAGSGTNSLTLSVDAGSTSRIDAIYIRRKGCEEWSDNLGMVLPGKNIHILNLDNGEIEVFWREAAHQVGVTPQPVDMAPAPAEWPLREGSRRSGMKASGKTLMLEGEQHRRIVIS